MLTLASSPDSYRRTDGEILDLVQGGQLRDAGRMLVQAYGAEILGTCIGRLGDRALGEDAAQDALARGIAALPAYEGIAGLRPWLHRIAANRCIDLVRRQQRRVRRTAPETALDQVPVSADRLPRELAEDSADAAATLSRVRSALARIKEPDRTWVELHYAHGVSYEDIALQEGTTRTAVKQRIWRAMQRLRKTLAKTRHA